MMVLGASSAGVVWLLAPGEADRLRRENEALERARAELHRAIERLTAEHRVAYVHVIDQIRKGELLNGQPAERPLTTIEFIELDRQQMPLSPRRFVVEDEVIYFDALVAKFEHESVASGDPLRGKSVLLFRRIFGEHQKPAEGYLIDPEGDVPDIYRVNPRPSELESRLWSRFWDYATDRELAAKDGVRLAQGEAVYAPMRRGQVWALSLQNTGDLNLRLERTEDARGSRDVTRKPDEPI